MVTVHLACRHSVWLVVQRPSYLLLSNLRGGLPVVPDNLYLHNFSGQADVAYNWGSANDTDWCYSGCYL